jgi:hypothetical protein
MRWKVFTARYKLGLGVSHELILEYNRTQYNTLHPIDPLQNKDVEHVTVRMQYKCKSVIYIAVHSHPIIISYYADHT